jgi:predicted nuclease of predicted toxin-antitoxin system
MMKILLDENLPKKLKRDLSEHTVFTVRECGWNGKKNGELLVLMQQELFDVLITFDKNLRHQQNFTKYTVSVNVIKLRLKAASNLTLYVVEFVPLDKGETGGCKV